jgi:hypothetical protein
MAKPHQNGDGFATWSKVGPFEICYKIILDKYPDSSKAPGSQYKKYFAGICTNPNSRSNLCKAGQMAI